MEDLIEQVAGHKYKKDGEYHKKGLNVNYEVKQLGGDRRGKTTTDGKNTITVAIDSDLKLTSQSDKLVDASTYSPTKKEAISSMVMTIFHETFLHGEMFAQDHLQDDKFDYSNILVTSEK